MKIGIYVAHDDDAILGVGGKIIQYLKKGNDVYVVIFADGRNSHKAVLGIERNPTVLEVKTKRKEEMQKAMHILGVVKEKLYFLNLTDGEGRVWQNAEQSYKQALDITKQEGPDIIYFHHPDAHRDHQAVSKIILKMLKKLKPKPKAYQFFIWTKELAKGRPEVSARDVPQIPKNAIKVNIKNELMNKREALYKMKSQISKRPYKNWDIQKSPILDKSFIDYFLRGEEIFIRAKSQN